ncbi:TPA: DUF192 domain-containing protein [Candidatus Edwardsbacteria bacterium]|nr:DUF192 domain-containing protein [Candidatus Edwardsbacteria bacterium]HBZ86244.1 DUF192 domain-containing protein [Candidatus Edwardsbacteria bacterium]
MMIILSLLSAAGCRHKTGENDRPSETNQVQSERPGRIKLTVGQSVLWVEVVDNPRSREQGLMFRKTMPGDEGMLFIFEYPQMQSFWMRNTYLPLDIAFISEQGVIINILTMKPLDEGPRYRSLAPALYVIEANAGWFGQNGIKAGDQVRF